MKTPTVWNRILSLLAMPFAKYIAILILTLGITNGAQAQSAFKVYTGFIYHFTKYTQWPKGRQSGEFVIGVIGSSEMKKELDNLSRAKKVGTRVIVVKEFSGVNDISKCHMLFVAADMTTKLSSILAKTKPNNTLVVTESKDAAKKGAVINFVQVSGKVRFEINMASAKAHGLIISTGLQKLAIIVG